MEADRALTVEVLLHGAGGWHVVLVTEQVSYDTYRTPMTGRWQQSAVQKKQQVKEYLATFVQIEQAIMVTMPPLFKVTETSGTTMARHTGGARSGSGRLKKEVDQAWDMLLPQLSEKMSRALKNDVTQQSGLARKINLSSQKRKRPRTR